MTAGPRIIALHNLIPFQHWTRRELLADSDDHRRFDLKWQVSQVALYHRQIVGLCIAFYDRSSQPGLGFLYLHRIVVAPNDRRQGVGRLLVKAACRNFVAITSERKCDVVVRTPATKFDNEAASALGFYLKIGFRIVGEKALDNRVDHVLQAIAEDF